VTLSYFNPLMMDVRHFGKGLRQCPSPMGFGTSALAPSTKYVHRVPMPRLPNSPVSWLLPNLGRYPGCHRLLAFRFSPENRAFCLFLSGFCSGLGRFMPFCTQKQAKTGDFRPMVGRVLVKAVRPESAGEL
jgi:hypothetical protein